MNIWEETTDKNENLRKFRTFFIFVIFLNFGKKIMEILVRKDPILVRKTGSCLRGLSWPPKWTQSFTVLLNRPNRVQ